MRKPIRLTESDLRHIITESVINILKENNNFYQKDIIMQKSMENGGPDKVWESFLSKKNSYYGKIAKLAQENNHSYTDVLKDLQNRIINFNKEGRFGKNQTVIQTVNDFCSLLAYLNGAYEAAVSRLRNRNGNAISEGIFNGFTYKQQNKYGVQQKVGNDKTGEWMKQLQGELNQLLQWNYLHGPKTVEATKAFIEFLEVEKRGINIPTIPLKKLRNALIGVALLGNVLNVYAPNVQQNFNNNFNQQQKTQQVQQMQKQNIQFNVNSSKITQQTLSVLQQMGQNGGTFQIIIHQSQNRSGRDASYEGQLVQQRANVIKNALGQKCKTVVTRGNNANTPYVEVIPGN